MARAIWSGEIAFGLVTIPAKLYTATRDLTPSFNQLHKECGSRIQMRRHCATCDREVEWNEVGKGYEVSKGQYALFTKEELAKLEGEEAAGGIDIVEFIEPSEVDLAYIGKSYWVGPGGKSSRGFALLREALEASGRVAVAKVRLRTRTQLGLLRPREKLFSLEMMRFADELVGSDDIGTPDAKPANEREMKLALNLVDQLAGPFDPTKHPDEYRAAFQEALAEKTEAGEVQHDASEGERDAAHGSGKVIDLAELLSRSIEHAPAANEGGAKHRGVKKAETAKKTAPAGRKKAAGGS